MSIPRQDLESSSDEDENTPIIANQKNTAEELQRQQIMKAVDTMNYLIIISFWTVIIMLSIFVAYMYQGYEYQIYLLFITLWVGHILFFGYLYQIFSMVQECLMPSAISAADVDTPYFTFAHNSEALIPLTLFVVHNIVWIFGTAVFILLSEILFFLSSLHLVSVSSGLIPIYILLGLIILNNIICKSANIFGVISMLLVTVGVIMVNLKLSTYTKIEWAEVLIPFNLLMLFWLIIMVFILFSYISQYYKLKLSQAASLFLYIGSFVGYLITINFLSVYLLTPSSYQLIVTLISFIISTILMFIGVSIDVRTYLNYMIARMGNAQPVALKRIHFRDGSSLLEENVIGFDADPAKATRNFILLGDIELSTAGDINVVEDYEDTVQLRKSLFDSFFGSCCISTIEMLTYSKSKRRRRSISSSIGSNDHRYGSDSSTGNSHGSRNRKNMRHMGRMLESSDDEDDLEEMSYDRQKQREYRQHLQQQKGKRDSLRSSSPESSSSII